MKSIYEKELVKSSLCTKGQHYNIFCFYSALNFIILDYSMSGYKIYTFKFNNIKIIKISFINIA